MPSKLTLEKVIEKSKIKHGDIYDYSNVVYCGYETKIELRCKVHDVVFYQTPHAHLASRVSYGCKKCAEEKRQQTNLKKYGVSNILKIPKIREQIKQTNLGKYGVEHAMQSVEIKDKKDNTNLERHGVKNPMQLLTIQDKAKATNLKKYGVEYLGQCDTLVQKARRTMKVKYGFEHAMQAEEIKRKRNKTNLEKYGVKHATQLSNTIEKRNITNLEKYDRLHPSQIHIPKDTLIKLNDREWLYTEHIIERKLLMQISDEIGVSANTVARYLCKYEIEIQYYNTSMPEIEINEFVNLLGYTTITNTRKILKDNKELDIYLPDINKAIEYNGLYYHQNRGVNYHKNKTDGCNELGISLMHIWEDKWLDNKDITKENIIKFLTDVPMQTLVEFIIINLSQENPKIYLELDYIPIIQTNPELYSNNVWDCGEMILFKEIT